MSIIFKILLIIISFVFISQELAYAKLLRANGKSKNKKTKLSENEIYIEPNIFSGSINVVDLSNNSTGNIVSKTNFGLNVKWIQNWKSSTKSRSKTRSSRSSSINNGKISTNVFLDYKRQSFVKPINRTIDTNDINVFNFGLGITYFITSSLYTGLEGFYGQEIYFRSPNTNAISFDQANAYGAKMFVGWDLIDVDPYIIGFKTGYKITIPGKISGTYNADNGSSIMASIYLKYDNYICELTYDKTTKNTEYFDQAHTYIFFKMGLKWGF